MPFLSKWMLSSCVIAGILFILSFIFSAIREIPVHPSVLSDDKYPYSRKRKRNRRWVIGAIFLLSILFGAIAAGIWTGIDYYLGVA